MLKEINIEELNDYDPENVIVLHDEAVYTLEEFRPVARFLVDLDDEPEADEEDEDDQDPAEEDDQGSAVRRKRRSPEEIVELIKNAQANGCVTIPEIMEYTAIRYDTVKKYLIMMEEEE